MKTIEEKFVEEFIKSIRPDSKLDGEFKEAVFESIKDKTGRAFNLKHFANKEFYITGEETYEDLKAKIGALTRELYKAEDDKTKLQDEIFKLRDKVDSLKEERKHLLQDKNAVINLTKGFLDDTMNLSAVEQIRNAKKYLNSLRGLNIGTNDSNTKVYLEVKKDRDNYKRLVKMYKRKSKELYEQNQRLLQDINILKIEIEEEKERTRLAFKALRLQTKGK